MPMKLSPQSNAVVSRLLSGQSAVKGKVTIGPLDKTAQSLLAALIKHFDELDRLKGEERARVLRNRFTSEVSATVQATNSPPAVVPFVAFAGPPCWRLAQLRCESIRGIAPPGEEFHFDFHCKSNLLYGPNGSGKSSLLGAITWILTGEAIVDTAGTLSDAPVYKPSDGSLAGAKLRDWPVVATLPCTGDVTKATPNCWGELLLERPSDRLRLHLRRKHGTSLEASLDGTSWTRLENLAQIGIEPLDVQLSVIAPTIFGRRSIEEADHTRNILGLMLGFDDLEQLGELASQLSGNRTRLANSEKADIDAKAMGLAQALRLLSAQLPEGSESAATIMTLANSQNLTVVEIDAAIKGLQDATQDAEKHLAGVLGLQFEPGKPSGNLADKLTIAVDQLQKGVDSNFPSLAALRIETVLPIENETPSETRLGHVHSDFQQFTKSARVSIERRYEWWLQESAPGSKAALLLKAAQHFQSETGNCPVCDRPIDNSDLRDRLAELKALDSRLGAELRTFFDDLSSELRALIPKTIGDLTAKTVVDRIDNDWTALRDETLGDAFATVTAALDEQMTELNSSVIAPESDPIPLLPQKCDERFTLAATGFRQLVDRCQHCLALLKWGVTNLSTVCDKLDALITSGVEGRQSLFIQLAKGKTSAQLVKPLVAVGRELANAKKTQAAIDSNRANLKVLESLDKPIDCLKLLSKYAESAVRAEFDAIKHTTAANLLHLYPENPTGMRPGKLKLGKGKDKSVEALLAGTTFEVPGQYFANAGLQRAIALAFYFALLDCHPGGMGFIVMDDPILSLDEEHRERWSAHILKPKLQDLQVILATHQRQFMRHCANDFAADRIVDLNPRDRNRRMSWKPGDRLKRAGQQLRDQGDHLAAATTMRKFREDVLISLDAYSPMPFFDPNDLTKSATSYERLPPHSPLAGEGQRKISDQLKASEVRTVLDPGSHSLTEADVTAAMADDCLTSLELIDLRVANELARLDRLRERSLRSSVIEATLVPFPPLDPIVTWSNQIELAMVGAAAAKSNPWAVEFSEEHGRVLFGSGAAVQVCSDSLEPVARVGQWVLLADDSEEIHDGDLVALRDEHGANYLRRVWSDGRSWILQSINPVHSVVSVTVGKRLAGIRKIKGVLYRPTGSAAPKAGRFAEWLPCTSLNAEQSLASCRAIDVQGDSLSPIALDGQKVLVDEPLTDHRQCPDGELAVIEFADDDLGSVIKQVFRQNDFWSLVSPNPVDRLAPIIVKPEEIRAIWLLRGVLFESAQI